MALGLDLWAQINLIGHMSLTEFWSIDEQEALACLYALNNTIEKAHKSREAEDKRRQSAAALDALENKYRGAR